MKNKVTVIIPTYNEKDNIIELIQEILKLPLDIGVMVVDDNSLDMTGEMVKEAFSENPNVEVWIRKGERGRGLAGIFGYRKAISKESEIIGEMDGDFSHHPEFIPTMIKGLENADVVIGSRYLEGGAEQRKSFIRKIITKFAQTFLRLSLGIRLSDPTSGFRFFKRQVLEEIIDLLKAKDVFIVTEVIFHLKREGFRIGEVPILFYERKTGRSKLRASMLLNYPYKVLKLRWRFRKDER